MTSYKYSVQIGPNYYIIIRLCPLLTFFGRAPVAAKATILFHVTDVDLASRGSRPRRTLGVTITAFTYDIRWEKNHTKIRRKKKQKDVVKRRADIKRKMEETL